MIRINYKGKPTKYPLYDTEAEARQAMVETGVNVEDFDDTWTSPRGVEKIITFEIVEETKGGHDNVY